MRDSDRTVLLGDPGGGKSTAAHFVALTCARDNEGPIPFVVVLREFARSGDFEESIADYITAQCKSLYQCPATEWAVEYLLLSGRAFVIFDGLDELIDTSRRREVTERVELFANRYPLCRILVTSRLAGYDQARLDPSTFSSFVLSGFTRSDIESYVRNWFTNIEGAQGESVENTITAFLKESASVPDLTSNPLMLSLLCIIYRGQGYLPRNRPAVYERCATLLFDKWDSSRSIHVDLKAAGQVDNAVKHIAYWMLTDSSRAEAVLQHELVRETANYLSKLFEDESERVRAAQEFVDFCRGRAWVLSDAGTTADGEALFKFTHRTFMEYFAAYELTRRCDSPEQLARVLLPRIAADEWEVVAKLAVQIIDKHSTDGATRVFLYLLGDRRRRSAASRDRIHRFIWECLSFVSTEPAVVRRLALASVTSTLLALRSSETRGVADGRPSLANCHLLLPEVRTIAGEALDDALVGTIENGDSEDAAYGRVILASLGVGPDTPAATEDYWNSWVAAIIDRNPGLLVSEDAKCRDAWHVLAGRRVVRMAAIIDQCEVWGTSILEFVFAEQETAPFRWAYLNFGSTLLLSLGRFQRGPDDFDYVVDAFRTLGRAVSPDTIRNALSSRPRIFDDPGMTQEKVEAVCVDEDAAWGLWVVASCAAEELVDRDGEQASSQEGSVLIDLDSRPFVTLLAEARAGRVSLDDLVERMPLRILSGERRRSAELWLGGRIDICRRRDGGDLSREARRQRRSRTISG